MKAKDNVEKINGIPVDNLTYESIIRELPVWKKQKRKMVLASINPHIATYAHKDAEVIRFIRKASHRLPDGVGIVLISKLFGGQIKKRVTGIDLLSAFFRYGSNQNERFFFYGAEAAVLKKAVYNVEERYPDLKIADYIDGYTQLSDEKIVERINQSNAMFLVVGLGFPLQERFLAKYVDQIDSQVIICVGGSFDVLGEKIKRAPAWLIQFNLEWFYRCIQRPKRMKRLGDFPLFLMKAVAYHLRYNKGNRKEK